MLTKDSIIVAVASVGEFEELNDLNWSPLHPCELARIGVAPAMQRRGIGSIILQRIMDLAKNSGYDGIVFLVSKGNAAALALYEKNGFEKCGEVFRFDLDFYCYQLRF